MKSIKRAIEEVAVEAPPTPVKILKFPPPQPPPEPTPSEYQPEVVRPEEQEVRPTPGKLKKIWPPPPSEMEVAPKIDPSVEMVSCNVSSIISSFSALSEEQEAYTSHHAPVVHQPKPQHHPQVSEVMDIDIQPEPAPEYGFASSDVVEEEQQQEEPEALQQVILPGPEPEFVLVEPPEPEEEIIEEERSELEMIQGYQRVSAPITDLHKILSPVPEVEPEPVPTPEPPRIVTPEPPRVPTPEPPKEPTPEPPKEPTPEPIKEPTPEPPREPTPEPPKEPTPEPPRVLTPEPPPVQIATVEVAQEPPEPTASTEVRTETSTVESSFFESKKSISKSSYSTVETKVYTTGISSPPLEQPTAPVIPVPVEEPQPVLEVMETQPVESYEPPLSEEPVEYFVPESEEIVEYVPAEESAPEMISEAEELAFTQSSLSSMKSEMKTIFVATSDLKTNVYAPEPEEPPLEPLIMPEPLPIEQLYVAEEAVKPPKPPDAKEQKKPKKKRETVIQIAKRLEENIVPMSPDEVPGGIRMFPSPKQPSTPVKESPAPTRETRSECATPTAEERETKYLELEPFPFTVEERPRRDRPKSLPPPWPSKFTPGAFTDSEYESDFDGERHIHLKKIKFEVPAKSPRPHSVATDAVPPSAFDTPPVFEGGMRPEILKKEEKVEKEQIKKQKTVAPKKKAKVVEKFLASAGEKAEIEVVKPVPRTPVKRDAAPAWPPPAMADESHIESQQTGGVYKTTTSMTSSFEAKSHVTSMSVQSHVSKVTQETKQSAAPPPQEIVLQPEPAPVYVLQPEPEPVYVQPPEPEPVYEPPAEPAPVYELQPEPEPVYVQQPEPEPVLNLQPEPAPVYEIQPEPKPVPVADVAPKFRPVQAPAPKQTPVKPAPAPAPPPPFDVPPPVFKPVVKPEVTPVQVPQMPVSTEVKKQVSKESIQTVKKIETSSASVQKSQKVLKKGNLVWPPEAPAPSVQFRSQSAERPNVSEAPSFPQRPHEAPAAIYWFSNITLKEKRKSWPQVMPEQPQQTTSTVIESTTKSSRQEISQMSKQSSETRVVQETTTQLPRQPLQEMPKKVPAPKPKFQVKAPKIEPKKEVVVQAPPPPREIPTVNAAPLPPLEPFPFSVEPTKPKKPRGQAPGMPSKFIPGSFTESEYESDYDSMSGSFSRMYMSDSEATGYRPLNIKMKKGRTKKPKQPSPPPPSTFGPPLAFEVQLAPLKVSFSDIESDIPTSRESTPLLESKLIQSKQKLQVHQLQTLASEITPGSKPPPQHFIPQRTEVPVKKPAPVVPAKPIPDAPKVVAQPIQVPPQPVQQVAPPVVAQSSFMSTEQSMQKSVQQVTSETVPPVVGVKNVKKMFEGGGPPPMPQAVAAPVRMQSPSPVRAQPPPPASFAPVQAPVPPRSVAPPQPAPAEPPTRIIPVAVETNAVDKVEQVSTTTHVKGKPSSPKAKKKTEVTQMTAQELEESGYTADTEGTLPRRTAKTAQSSSNFTSSSSFSKSETFMSSSFSKSESKSFTSSQFDQGMPPSFPVDSSFPAGGGLPPEGSFPSSFPSFPSSPASTLGQTSHFSSSFKSSESKASQVRKGCSSLPSSVVGHSLVYIISSCARCRYH